MTALSRNIVRKSQGGIGGGGAILALMAALPVLASTKIYTGALVAITPAGYLTNASADASLRVVGVYEDGVSEVDNSAGSSGDLTCKPTRKAFYFTNSSSTDAITDGDIGRAAFVVDNNTVARTSAYGARPVAGRVIGVDDFGVLVEVGAGMDPQADCDLLVLASEDLSAKQFYAVDLTNSSGSAKAVAISAAGQRVAGILQNAPASGAVAIVRPVGCGRVSKMISGGSVTAAESLGVTSAGKAKTIVKAKVDTSDAGAASDPVIGSNACGIALVSGATDNDVITVLLSAQGAVPTTAA